MNYKRSEKINVRIATILFAIVLSVFAILVVYLQEERRDLIQQNSEYLSVIEEYSVEYAELENKLTDYKKNTQNYKAKIKKYESQINNYEAQIKKQKATIEAYEVENEQYKEQLEEISYSDNVYNDDVDYASDGFTGNITGYCGCEECCGVYATDDEVKYGATGMELISGYSVASDYYDMGTILYIEGYGEVQVADRFGAGYSKEYIDIYFTTHSEADTWGRQYLTVSVVS